jgi:Putative peptidoglycan binding domain
MSYSSFVVYSLCALFAGIITGAALADELTLDGKPSAEVTKALKDYQQRHHLPATGVLDRATAKALDDENGLALPQTSVIPVKEKAPSSAQTPAPNAAATPPLPSPAASTPPKPTSPPLIPSASPAAPATTPSPTLSESPSPTEKQIPPGVSPSPPAEGPATFASERVTRFLRSYFDAGEGKSVSEQLSFYSFPVNYFGHGKVNSQFVRNEILRTIRRWPRRSYRLNDDLVVTPVSAEIATVEFTVSYTLQKGKQRVTGRKNDRVTLRQTKGRLKIVAIRERRD